MKQIRKKTLDKATESALSMAAAAGIPLPFDRYEDMVPICGFGRMGLDCKACTQGPCRINPFDATNGTACGREREGTVAAAFLRLIADGAVAGASYAGAQSQVAATVFEGIALANEGAAGAAQLLQKAVEVAGAGFQALAGAGTARPAVARLEVGAGTLRADKVNILLVGSIPAARARAIAAELSANPKVNVVGAAGGESAGGDVAGNYNSEEALLVTATVDGVVAGQACVSPGFLTLAARQGVPVAEAANLDAAALLDRAEAHFRMNQGRNLAARFQPARAVAGFGTGAFAGLSAERWAGLAAMGVKGVALVGGCNNAATTQDAAIVRQAEEFLKSDVVVVASGCAAVALAKAGYMDPARREAFAGRKLRGFLAALSEATGLEVPAVLGAGTCWEIPAALDLARTLARRLGVGAAASMPEVSRPAAWASALAVAALGVPTYVGPVLPLDGGLETVKTLNDLLGAAGGSLLGPGQVSDPEAFVKMVRGIPC